MGSLKAAAGLTSFLNPYLRRATEDMAEFGSFGSTA